LGYLLSLPNPVRHALQVFVAGAYAAPHLEGQIGKRDLRLPGNGRSQYAIDQKLLAITVGVLGRLPLRSDVFAPYLALGYRGYAFAAKVSGDVAGQEFGSNTEQGYEHGFYAAAGIDVFVGPGALLAEVQLAYAGHDGVLLRDTNLGALQALLGYRLMFGSRSDRAREAADAGAGAETDNAREPVAASAVSGESEQPAEAPPPAAAEIAESKPAAEEVDPSKGQIRGNVRSLKGAPLHATVVVLPEGIRSATNEDGSFALDVAPGRHEVRLRAAGYKPQSRHALVDGGGITILNVELIER
jgi:hypothetical protein